MTNIFLSILKQHYFGPEYFWNNFFRLDIIWKKINMTHTVSPISILEKKKATSIFWQLKYHLNSYKWKYFGRWKTTSIFWKMEHDLNILANGRRPQYFGQWKTTSIFWQMEDKLNILTNGRRPQYFETGR